MDMKSSLLDCKRSNILQKIGYKVKNLATLQKNKQWGQTEIGKYNNLRLNVYTRKCKLKCININKCCVKLQVLNNEA